MKLHGLVAGAALLAFGLPQSVLAQAAPKPPAARPSGTQAARPAAQAPAQPAIPNAGTQLIMIRTHIDALNQANMTNNYSVLWQLGSENFRKGNTPQSLSQAFTPFRERRISLSPSLVLNPQLFKPVAIANGRLQIQGYFPSQPMRIVFDLLFDPTPVGGWQLANLNVSLSPVQQQQAPQQQPAPRPTAQPPKKQK